MLNRNRVVPMSGSRQALVRQQFDRQVAHYLAPSTMVDRRLLEAIVAAAPIQPGQRLLDVACGAGFLMLAYQEAGADVYGVDLSEGMLREASKTLGVSMPSEHLMPADVGQLPFDSEAFDVVTCKLAMHYFPDPHRAAGEMVRVCRTSGQVVLIDRIACDTSEQSVAQYGLEKLRTPTKVRVFAEGELARLLVSRGLTIVRREPLVQPMDFEEWMAATGAQDRAAQARALLIGPGGEDLTGLGPREEAGRLVIHHRTVILIAKPVG